MRDNCTVRNYNYSDTENRTACAVNPATKLETEARARLASTSNAMMSNISAMLEHLRFRKPLGRRPCADEPPSDAASSASSTPSPTEPPPPLADSGGGASDSGPAAHNGNGPACPAAACIAAAAAASANINSNCSTTNNTASASRVTTTDHLDSTLSPATRLQHQQQMYLPTKRFSIPAVVTQPLALDEHGAGAPNQQQQQQLQQRGGGRRDLSPLGGRAMPRKMSQDLRMMRSSNANLHETDLYELARIRRPIRVRNVATGNETYDSLHAKTTEVSAADGVLDRVFV